MAKNSPLVRAFDFFLALFGVGEVENKDIDAVVRTVHDPGGKLRLGIYHRKNETYIWREEVFNNHILHMEWQPGQTSPDDGFNTPEEALQAARKTFPWVDSVLG
jgi:hypothetical protein